MKWIVEAESIDDVVLGNYAIRDVPLIECKNCKYWEETMNDKGYCKDMYGFGRWWKADDYCSRAERHEE